MNRVKSPVARSLELNVLSTRDEMGKAAARGVAEAMKRFIRERGRVNVVFAAAPSQDEFLAHLVKNKSIGPPASIWMTTWTCRAATPILSRST